MTLRSTAIRYAWTWLGRPYIWGGDDPSGVDCSGLIIEILAAVGVIPRYYDTTAAGLYQRFADKEISGPKRGALIFYTNLDGKIVHVGLFVNPRHIIHAGGGGPQTLTASEAWKRGAFVKLDRYDYRTTGEKYYVDPFPKESVFGRVP